MSNQFDVIIAGAGISGLLLASELSKSLNILVLESQKQPSFNKFWVTLRSSVDLNPELSPYVNKNFDNMEFRDAYHNIYNLTGKYSLWNPEELVGHLKNTITANNGQIKYAQRFYGYRNEKSSIKIFVNQHNYSTRLLIDCMGYKSPLILAKDLVHFKGYYMLYGAKLSLKHSIPPICLSNPLLHKSPKYFEVFPTENMEAYATMIFPTSSVKDMASLEKDFNFIINESYYSKYFDTTIPITKLSGIVPVGTIKRKALEKIFFFGESAQSNPAATGTALTMLLSKYKTVAEFIIEKVKTNDLSEASLVKSPEILNPFIRDLQLYAFRQILSWNSDQFAKFIKAIGHIDHSLLNRFIFGELTSNEVFNSKNMLKFFKKENSYITRQLIQSFF